jgi:cytochrome c-type biogenesis protein CcmH/NrfG
VIAMDDKELIKRIMEEVKDEKLREELLALVVEKNKEKDATKQEGERLIDYLARLEILGRATEELAKVSWWVAYIVFIVFVLVGSLGSLGLFGYFLTPAKERSVYQEVFAVFFSIMFIIGLAGIFALRNCKKEHERFKHEGENQGQS